MSQLNRHFNLNLVWVKSIYTLTMDFRGAEGKEQKKTMLNLKFYLF